MVELTKAIELAKSAKVVTSRGMGRCEYINLPCGFDIETSSVEISSRDGHSTEKAAFMYVWMLGIGHDTDIIYGRTWEELVSTLTTLSNELGLRTETRDEEGNVTEIGKHLVIYVHNLAYEFQFMQNYFEWDNIFALSERKPAKAVTSTGIEFRCSYLLSGMSLAQTARNLTTHSVAKAEGDLDYSITRTHLTPLTEQELHYCDNDIRVLTAYIDEQIAYYDSIHRIPMTNTGRVRNYVREQCLYPKNAKGKVIVSQGQRYRSLMQELTLTPEQYTLLRRGFMGGFTHANANYQGQTLNNVTSMDFTSSYPSVMVAEKFPMSKFKPIRFKSLAHFQERAKYQAIIMDVVFMNIRPRVYPNRTIPDHYISASKCMVLKDEVIDNGRVVQASELHMTMTEVDFSIIEKTYEWDNIAIPTAFYADKGYLPKPIVECILNLFKDKTELKGVEGREADYQLSKGMLNSIYGMTVTDIIRPETLFEQDEFHNSTWETKASQLETKIDEYNKQYNRFLSYPWGVWITAYARRNLWTGILACESDYAYADTDSIKILNHEKHIPYFDQFDHQMIAKMTAALKHHGLDPTLITACTVDGKSDTLGIWDFDGFYTRFKTLGAKRYLVEYKSGSLELTVAGLGKAPGLASMQGQLGQLGQTDEFDLFTKDLYIPADQTGKMTHTYIDETLEFEIEDYLGNRTDVNVRSGIHLEQCDFTLSISSQYEEFLSNLSQGVVFRGYTAV